MKMQEKSSRALRRGMALGMSLALIVSSVAVSPSSADAASKKKPTLSAKKKTLTYNNSKKKSFTLKIKKNKVKKIKKTTWKTSKKSVVSISKKKKTSVKVTAKKKGSAKITATVKYTVKGSKKVKTAKLTCKVTSKKGSSSKGDDSTSKKTNAPAATTPAGGGSQATATPTNAGGQPTASAAPTEKTEPSAEPTEKAEPSAEPTKKAEPSAEPTKKTEPSAEPTKKTEPSAEPTKAGQTPAPTAEGETPAPTGATNPTTAPTGATNPTTAPTGATNPTTAPTGATNPTTAPTGATNPTTAPTGATNPTTAPTGETNPTAVPTDEGTAAPTATPQQTDSPASGSAVVAIVGSSVSDSAISINAGQTANVSAEVTVSGCAVTGYEWNSSDEAVVTVAGNSEEATLTAVGAGTATVTVTVTTDTGLEKPAELAVTVIGPEAVMTVSGSASALIPAGETRELVMKATIAGEPVAVSAASIRVTGDTSAVEVSDVQCKEDGSAVATIEGVALGSVEVVADVTTVDNITVTTEPVKVYVSDTDVALTKANIAKQDGLITDAEEYTPGEAIENEDGSITYYTSALSSGGGICLYLNPDKSDVDFSKYSKIQIVAEADPADRQLVFDMIASNETSWWSSGVAKDSNNKNVEKYATFAEGGSTVEWDISNFNGTAKAIKLKYNGYNQPRAPKKEGDKWLESEEEYNELTKAHRAKVTIKSIKFVE